MEFVCFSNSTSQDRSLKLANLGDIMSHGDKPTLLNKGNGLFELLKSNTSSSLILDFGKNEVNLCDFALFVRKFSIVAHFQESFAVHSGLSTIVGIKNCFELGQLVSFNHVK